MKDDKEFSVLNDIPAGALGGMHPEQRRSSTGLSLRKAKCSVPN